MRRISSTAVAATSKRSNTLLREGIGPADSVAAPNAPSSSAAAQRSSSSRPPAGPSAAGGRPEQKAESDRAAELGQGGGSGGGGQVTASVGRIRERCLSQLSAVYDRRILDLTLHDAVDCDRSQDPVPGAELVRFEDIVAMDYAKRTLQEVCMYVWMYVYYRCYWHSSSRANGHIFIHQAVVLPLLLPEFFTGLRQPWRVGYRYCIV